MKYVTAQVRGHLRLSAVGKVDETDGLNFYNGYGMLRGLFAGPALAAGKRYAEVPRGYLRAGTIGPLPFRRLAAAHPQTVGAVFQKVLRQPNFTWAEHGEALLRQRRAPGRSPSREIITSYGIPRRRLGTSGRDAQR